MNQTNLSPPSIGQQLPVYPQLLQLVRVTGAAVATNVYPCIVQQVSTLTLRDREDSYVLDCNATGMAVGYYNARLVGVYNSKPLYATGGASGGNTSITIINGSTTYLNITTIILPNGSVTSVSGNTLTIESLGGGNDINEWKLANFPYTSNCTSTSSGGAFSNYDTLYLIPIIIDEARTLTKMGMFVKTPTAPATGGLMTMVLYRMGSSHNILPHNMITTATDLSTDSNVSLYIEGVPGSVGGVGGSPVSCAAGLYWLGYVLNNLANGIGMYELNNVVSVLPIMTIAGAPTQALGLWSTSGGWPYGSPWSNDPITLSDEDDSTKVLDGTIPYVHVRWG